MNLINIILSVLVSTIGAALTIKNLSKDNIKNSDLIKFIVISFPLLLLNCIFFTDVNKILSSIFIIIVSLYFSIFPKNISKSIYYSFVYEFMAFIIELLICIIELLIFSFDKSSYESLPFAMFITSLVNVTIIYFISKINILRNSLSKYYNIVINNLKDWIYIVIILVLMILLVVFNGYNLENNLSFYINVGMSIFVFISGIYLIYNRLNSNKLESKYNEMMDYLSKYEKVINDQGKKNHEYNNQLMVLKGYLNKPDKLKEYLDLIIEDHKCGQNYMIKQLSYFPDGGIKGLIYHKISRMEEFGIKPYLYIDSKLKDVFEENLDINTYKDITKLLGVFLDNAIDATKDADKKEIDFEIKREDKCLIITISNTYSKDCNVSQIGKKGFSTKGTGHGFGLSIVKDISRTNENIETFSNSENDRFKQTIIVYYK